MQIFDFLKVRSAKPAAAAPYTPIEFMASPYGDQMVAQGLPERAMLTAAGDSFVVEDTTARAAVTAIPTTASLYGVWNGNPAAGKVIVVDAIGLTVIAQTATTAFAARVIANLIRINLAAPAAVGTVTPLNGAMSWGGGARGFATPTTVAADGWFSVGTGIIVGGGVTCAPGPGIIIPVNGSIIIQPQKALALSILGTATAVTGLLSVWGHEVMLPVVN